MSFRESTLTGEWQFSAVLRVENIDVPGEWDSVDGGDTTSDTRSYRAGGAVNPEALPAAAATGDVILERAYRGTIDGRVRSELGGNIGRPAMVTVYAQDKNRNPVPGTSETIRGILKEVTRPAFRSEGDGTALYRVVVAPHGHWTPS
ncbi:hypothetical protein [Conexibacter woesei]|uniref:Uncharacterized protein n=1 Tax=Conexibacter woesei (strain DSM 14684 / CCUG 47730 / CIP 108061 / JCM 11494 / NBRC 100937 / ID131577) TaxID=469383 RepID=D3F1Z1_CONWI|nr:hypothetical protein [Conexibacter woesei]ADB50166.1 hypothetical protein Cwoe_1739 [Conexibacter woesei DSM 14684]